MHSRCCAGAGAIVALVACFSARAEEPPADGGADARLAETVVVTATRTERPQDEVAATVSVVTDADIDAAVAQHIGDLVRFEPGVSVAGTGSRFGRSGFAIRGMGGNRVVTLVDGVRVAEAFAFGPFLNARRDFVDVESLARVEIARGPISSLYGSDALGGVVALTTKRPRDYLRGERAFAGALKGGYSGADGGAVASGSLVAGGRTLSGLLTYTRRAADESGNRGSRGGTGPRRERPDPQSIDQDNLTAKLVWAPSRTHTLTLGLERYANSTETDLLSDHGIVLRGTMVDRSIAEDDRERHRFSLRYDYEGDLPIADTLRFTVYQQDSETRQSTRENRTTPRRMRETRTRDSLFEQGVRGGLLQLTKNLRTGAASHRVTYGIDYYVTENAALRDGATFDAAGDPQRERTPWPTRGFPLTQVTHQAVFAQDEITLFDGRLLLFPGVRYDKFSADVRADAVYRRGNPGAPEPVDYADSEVTATLGAMLSLRDGLSAHLRYSEGFRAPGFAEVNVGRTDVVRGYKTISNPGLASERSQGVESGLRIRGAWGTAGVVAFRNTYRNFIEQFAIAPAFIAGGGRDPADGLVTFQSVNRADVRISGWELSAEVPLGERLALQASAAYASGKDTGSGKPLNSVEPLTAVIGLGYSAPKGDWGANVLWTLARGKDAKDVNLGDVGDVDARIAAPSGLDLRFTPPPGGYGVVDVLAHWNIGALARLNAGLFNVGDKAYIRWADTVGIVADAPARFTQPGRNVGLSLRVRF